MNLIYPLRYAGAQGAPVLPPEAVRHIVERFVSRGPTAHELENAVPDLMSIIVDMDPMEQGKQSNNCVYNAGSIVLRGQLVPQQLFVRPDGTPLLTLKEDPSLEACLMPYMFPYGKGSFVLSLQQFTFPDYLRYRMKTLFSPWTLIKPYLLFAYQIRQVRTDNMQIRRE